MLWLVEMAELIRLCVVLDFVIIDDFEWIYSYFMVCF